MAEDETGNESIPSVHYSLQLALSGSMMLPNGVLDSLLESRELIWQNYYHDDTEDYCLTILSDEDEYVYRQIVQPRNYVGNPEYFTIPATVNLMSNQIYKWRIDTGAKYVNCRETAGSESEWATFVYVE